VPTLPPDTIPATRCHWQACGQCVCPIYEVLSPPTGLAREIRRYGLVRVRPSAGHMA
jgi:hypothetical protein